MADSSVTVTAGAGTNIDTRTEATNGHHRQVIVIGDPSTNAGVAPVDATAGLKVDLGADNDITGIVTANLSATDNAVLDNIDSDTSAIQTAVELLDNSVDGNYLNVNMNIAGTDVVGGAGTITDQTQRVTIATDDEVNNLLGTIDADTSAIAGAVSGTEMQADIVAALPAGANIIGKVDHAITGIAHGVKVVTTAGTDEALAGSTACKKVDIQAQTDNTGVIAVGATGVDATVATGTGILLNAGDTYSLEIDNLADIFIDSSVSGEGVRYTYYT